MRAQRADARTTTAAQPVEPAADHEKRPTAAEDRYGIVRVVKASHCLTALHKWVIAETEYFSRRLGYATVGAERLAEQLGVSDRQLKRARSQLRQYGLLSSERGRRGTAARWWPDLPLPLVIPDRKAAFAQIQATARRLDELLHAAGAAPRRPNEVDPEEPETDEQLSVPLLALARPVTPASLVSKKPPVTRATPPGDVHDTGTSDAGVTPPVTRTTRVPVTSASPTSDAGVTQRLLTAPPSSEPKTETKEEEPAGGASPPLDAARSPPAEWATTKAEVRRHVRSPPA